MKKYLITILALLAMLVIQVGSVAAAPMADGTATLVSVSHGENGPVFTFNVNGKFSRAELKGSLHVEGGADYSLHCTQVDETTVKCTTSDKVAGVNVSLSWGGSTFWTFVPEAPPPPVPASFPDTTPTEYCYNVYDYDTSHVWQSYGTHCQETPAEYGDEIPWYNPDYDDYYDAIFLPEGPFCSGIYEEAYYYPWCPS
ncbi:MAG: hypothetical protein L0287_38210 [Anaerolineae bacterium]|nr:hypothetical protein [Anaerolineae bacterium]